MSKIDFDKFCWLALVAQIEKGQEKKIQVPPKKKRRKGITHFVAIRIEHRGLWNKIEDIQKRIREKFPSLAKACTAALALHVTLLPLNLSTNEEIEKAKKIFLQLRDKRHNLNRVGLLDAITLKIQGLNRFGRKVLFCDFHKDTKERLRFLVKEIGQVFYNNSLTGTSFQNVSNYNPHATVMKMSKVRKVVRTIDPDVFRCANETKIDVEYDAVSIDLLSINRRAGEYYPVLGKLMIEKRHSSSADK